MKLNDYMDDGANYQAQAVLAFIRDHESQTKVARWENGREQGYVLTLVAPDYKEQLNIAFFEHRNSDSICAIKWKQAPSINTPTISTAQFNGAYKDKYDTSFDVGYGEIRKMGDWIRKELDDYIEETNKEKDNE
jgi:hypothetical protein